MHSYLLTFASRNKHSFHTFMKLCTTQTKNTNTVNLLITSTHIHVASTVLPRARSVPYPCTASRINHFQHHQSIIDTERQRERERERERDRHNKQNETSTGAIQRQDYRWLTHTQSHAHVRGSRTPLHQTRDTQAVQPSIMCGKTILRRALETHIPSSMHDSFLDEKCFITKESHWRLLLLLTLSISWDGCHTQMERTRVSSEAYSHSTCSPSFASRSNSSTTMSWVTVETRQLPCRCKLSQTW